MPTSNRPITPCLWFNRNAEEAATFYVSVFPNSSLGRRTHYTEAGFEIHGMPAGALLTIEFEINGQLFVALNAGGPTFKFTEAISLMVPCKDQAEVDRYWEKLSAGGDPSAQQCGWLKDRFGVSWQVVPTEMDELLAKGDQARNDKMLAAMFPMKKLDMAKLKAAYDS